MVTGWLVGGTAAAALDDDAEGDSATAATAAGVEWKSTDEYLDSSSGIYLQTEQGSNLYLYNNNNNLPIIISILQKANYFIPWMRVIIMMVQWQWVLLISNGHLQMFTFV